MFYNIFLVLYFFGYIMKFNEVVYTFFKPKIN